jgi:hypothetical protein
MSHALSNLCPSAGGKIFIVSLQKTLQMKKKILTHGINFHQQLMNLLTFIRMNYVVLCGTSLM